MHSHIRLISLLPASLLVAGLLAVEAAVAGPPLICHPVDIGGAKSLPWGWGAFAERRDYSPRQAVDDTLALLAKEPSVLVHMETLRRAALYTDQDSEIAVGLLAALMARALNSEAAGTSDALAWFDAGYLAQCYHQLQEAPLVLDCGSAQGVVGYGWIQRAIDLRGDDAGLEFAAAMVTALADTPAHRTHVARARKLAANDSLVRRNLEHHATANWPRHRRRHRSG